MHHASMCRDLFHDLPPAQLDEVKVGRRSAAQGLSGGSPDAGAVALLGRRHRPCLPNPPFCTLSGHETNIDGQRAAAAAGTASNGPVAGRSTGHSWRAGPRGRESGPGHAHSAGERAAAEGVRHERAGAGEGARRKSRRRLCPCCSWLRRCQRRWSYYVWRPWQRRCFLCKHARLVRGCSIACGSFAARARAARMQRALAAVAFGQCRQSAQRWCHGNSLFVSQQVALFRPRARPVPAVLRCQEQTLRACRWALHLCGPRLVGGAVAVA
mgnify:CR=1 FL=1